MYLTAADTQIGRGEPIQDTARTLSRYCDGIMIRTYQQDEIEALAAHATVPVINGMTDFAHPCQVLGDLMTCGNGIRFWRSSTSASLATATTSAPV